jgi:hypothetical protein
LTSDLLPRCDDVSPVAQALDNLAAAPGRKAQRAGQLRDGQAVGRRDDVAEEPLLRRSEAASHSRRRSLTAELLALSHAGASPDPEHPGMLHRKVEALRANGAGGTERLGLVGRLAPLGKEQGCSSATECPSVPLGARVLGDHLRRPGP